MRTRCPLTFVPVYNSPHHDPRQQQARPRPLFLARNVRHSHLTRGRCQCWNPQHIMSFGVAVALHILAPLVLDGSRLSPTVFRVQWAVNISTMNSQPLLTCHFIWPTAICEGSRAQSLTISISTDRDLGAPLVGLCGVEEPKFCACFKFACDLRHAWHAGHCSLYSRYVLDRP